MFIRKSDYEELLEKNKKLTGKNKALEDIVAMLVKQIQRMNQELTFKELLKEDRKDQIWVNTNTCKVVKKIIFTEEGEVVIKYNSNSQVYMGKETQVGIDVHDRFKREK